MPLHYRAVILSFDVDDPDDADHLAELVCAQVRPQMNLHGCEGESATVVPAINGQVDVPDDPLRSRVRAALRRLAADDTEAAPDPGAVPYTGGRSNAR